MNVAEIKQLLMNMTQNVSKQSTVDLKPGQILNVLLKEIQGETAILSLKGMDIVAKLETDVPIGETVKCVVMGEKNGQVMLKVVNSNAEANNLQYQNIASNMGLEPNVYNASVIRELINQQMPLNQDQIKAVASFMKAYNIPSDEASISVFMNLQGIPLNQENYTLIKDMLNNSNISKDFATISLELKQIISNTSSDSEINQIAVKITNLLHSLTMQSGETSEILAAKLSNLFQTFLTSSKQGTDGQTVISQKQQVTVEVSDGQLDSSPLVNMNSSKGNDLLASTVSLKDIKSNAGTPVSIETIATAQEMDSNPNILEQVVKKGQNSQIDKSVIPNSEQNIKAEQTMNVAQILDPKGKSETGTNVPNLEKTSLIQEDNGVGFQQVLSHTEPLLKQEPKILSQMKDGKVEESNLSDLFHKLAISLQKEGNGEYKELAHLAQTIADKLNTARTINGNVEPARENVMVMYTSFQFGEHQEPLKMIVNYSGDRNGKKRGDFSKCKVNVSLNTPNLGLVKCEIGFDNRTLAIQFTAINENVASLINGLQNVLGARLSEMGYRVKSLPCEVKPVTVSSINEAEEEPINGLFQVNMRV